MSADLQPQSVPSPEQLRLLREAYLQYLRETLHEAYQKHLHDRLVQEFRLGHYATDAEEVCTKGTEPSTTDGT